ncbi:AGE family epimerase/isomerase [Acidobacteriota bacterium]
MLSEYSLYQTEIQNHLKNELLPFWTDRILDREFGGFLTYFDRDGNPTGETDKALLSQVRSLYSLSAAHRAGYGGGKLIELAYRGYEFLIHNFWDKQHQGWYWIVSRDGGLIDPSKIVYGFSFAIYGLSEYYLASGDESVLDWIEKTLNALQSHAKDKEFGGYFELFERDWSLKPGGLYGGDRKTLDVHMHLMEAFTKMYEAHSSTHHKDLVLDVLKILIEKILHPETYLGVSQFTQEWRPLRAILFKTVWGADREVKEDLGRPIDNTSYGHNVELGWLMKESASLLGLEIKPISKIVKSLYEHCLEYGIDWERGGVYCEGPFSGPARERNKEFWQQAEAMVAMLDGFEHFRDKIYFDAYKNIHRFVFDFMINHRVGEWRPLFSPENEPVWDYMATAWKVNYHTIRSMLECEKRLSRIQID